MESTPLSHETYYLALGISSVCILVYYFVLKSIGRPLSSDPDAILKTPPHGLSPGAIRYLWTGDVDWDILPTIAFSAVQKGVYQLFWSKEKQSARFNLVNPQAFHLLSHDERAGLTMGRNVPLKGIVFNQQKKGLDEKMAHRVESYLSKKYTSFMNPVQRQVLIGLIAHAILILLSAFVCLELPAGTIVLAAVLIGFMLIGSMIYYDRFLDESSNSGKWGYAIFGTVLLLFFMAEDLEIGVMLMSAFGLMMPVHLWMYHHLPRHSKKGSSLRKEIGAYRNYLLYHKPYMEPADIPYCLALDIPCEETEQLSQLLTGAWDSKLDSLVFGSGINID